MDRGWNTGRRNQKKCPAFKEKEHKWKEKVVIVSYNENASFRLWLIL